MAEQHIDEFEGDFSTEVYKNVRDSGTGIWYRNWGAFPAVTNIIRMIHSVIRAVASAGRGRVYHDSTDADNEFSITALKFYYRGQLVEIAGSTGIALSGGDVAHYIYATTGGSISVSTSGWPSAAHVRIAVITLASGAWDWSSVVDWRHAGALRVFGEEDGGKCAVTAKTAGDTLTSANSKGVFTNSGAGAGVTLVLPSAEAGLVVTAAVATAQTLTLQAAAGDTIRVAGDVSAAAGTAASNTVGDTLTLVAIDSTQWIAVAATGTWTVT